MEEEKELTSHEFLYKIISLRNWQDSQNQKIVELSSEDENFIHLSTDEQLEKILTKYWSHAKNLVILKLDKSKLLGRLVYETNPNGVTKYFHLYEGTIPFHAILEAKIIYRQPEENNQLEMVNLGHPILRSVAKKLTKDEILSKEIQELIELMKMTMQDASGVGLAAPQIGKSIQLAVIEDVDLSHLSTSQLLKFHRYPVPFHVIINPHIYLDTEERVEFFEGCLSIPGFLGIVPRARSVRVEYLNENAETITLEVKGWYARILQHEIDHLNGILFIDRVLIPSLMTYDSYDRFWKGKSINEIKKALFLE